MPIGYGDACFHRHIYTYTSIYTIYSDRDFDRHLHRALNKGCRTWWIISIGVSIVMWTRIWRGIGVELCIALSLRLWIGIRIGIRINISIGLCRDLDRDLDVDWNRDLG